MQLQSLSAPGHDVVSHVVDVSRKDAVEALAAAAAARGSVTAVVHTAGVSPVQAPVEVKSNDRSGSAPVGGLRFS